MDKPDATTQSFPDHGQSYWELMSIQAAASGFPVILIGGQLAAALGAGTAITSIIIGNLILWMVGFTIISMAAPSRDNAIQNVRKFLGKTGGVASALFLIIAFLSWYILQINATISTIQSLFGPQKSSLSWGAALGFLTALLSVGGIYFIKRLCVIIFPILCFLSISLVALSDFQLNLDNLWVFSFSGTIAVFAVILPGIINLPTFFRHSRSRADSYLGLSLMTFFTILFQIFPIACGYANYESLRSASLVSNMLILAFGLVSLISTNLVNIYFASAGWEMVFPHRQSTKEYIIVGLLGTMAYTFLQISSPMQFLENMANNFIASLGAVLLLAFLVTVIVKHRPRPLEKIVNISAWFFGGVVGAIGQLHTDSTSALVMSISASSVLFLGIIFVEETIWAVRKVLSRMSR